MTFGVDSVFDLPYTISFVIRKRMQIDGWMELPKDKRPPESIWDKPRDIEEWFDRVYGDKQTEFSFNVNEIEE
ncbi:MAG: hypothetical protein ABIH92_04610 [Nanoarchaeota archaeon]